MNRIDLLQTLKAFSEAATGDILMPVSVQKGDTDQAERAAEVHLMRLPDSKSARKKAPYIIHQLITAKDQQNEGQWPEATAQVRSIFCVYHANEEEGAILLFDFSKFFDRVSHALTKGILRKQFTDERLLKIAEHFVDAFGDVGLGLGSQISQVLALASANRLDHYVKEVLRIRGYGRYMDDGYLIHPDKAYLQKCLEDIKTICDELEITLNVKKTQIVKLSHGFTWLKVRFFLTETGKVVRKIYRRSVTKMRQKLKSFHCKYINGEMRYEDIYTSWQSWRSYALRFNAYRTVQSMTALYNQLFREETAYALC